MAKNDPEYHRKYREANRERLRQQAKDYRRTSVARLWSAAKARAKDRGLPFNIEFTDIVIPEKCPVLGIPLSVGEGYKHAGSPSLDKFVPELGYVKGNVHVISDRANLLKSDATVWEMERVLEYMKNGC